MRLAMLVVIAACTSGKPIGATCQTNGECASGICWDYAQYDATCGGMVCSDHCATDLDCITMARDQLAAYADHSTCGTDHLCNFVGTGLGAFFCARTTR